MDLAARQADSSCSMRSYTGDEPGILPQLGEVGVGQYLSAAQWGDAVLGGLRDAARQDRGYPQQTGSRRSRADDLPSRCHHHP
jgi:hypothetical protein